MIILPFIAGFLIGFVLYILTRRWFWSGAGIVLAVLIGYVMIDTVLTLAGIAAVLGLGWLALRRHSRAPAGNGPLPISPSDARPAP